MLNEDFYKILVDLSKDVNFNETINITERLYEERYEMELVLRLLALANSEDKELRCIPDVSEFLTNKVKDFADSNMDWKKEKGVLSKSFEIINQTLGEDAFKRKEDNRFKGGFQLTIYEVIAVGSYLYIKDGRDVTALPKLLIEVVDKLRYDPTFQQYSGSGSKANYRWPKFVPLSKQLFLA